MKKLPGSILAVLLTWFTIASIVALVKGDGMEVFFLGYEAWFFTSVYGIATGVVLALIYFSFGHKFAHTAHLHDNSFSDEAVRIVVTDFLKPHANTKTVDYPVPIPPVAQPEEAALKDVGIDAKWYLDLREHFPIYANVIDQAYRVMMTKPGIPASPQGGHGGASLIEHSLHVVDSILSIREDWVYTGLKTKRGNLYRDLVDPDGKPHTFDRDDPILAVAAFVHDIGKVRCYQKTGSVWEEIRPGHGEIGSEMLRRMSSVRDLPIADRDALILAVCYYHHQSDMPIANWVGDRAYSLTGLLYLADCDASAREGDKDEKAEVIASYRSMKAKVVETRETTIEETEQENESLEQADEDDMAASAMAQMAASEPPGAAQEPSGGQTANSLDTWVSESGESAIDLFIQAISMPGAVNGKSTDGRFGIKFGAQTYIFEAQMRRRVASMLHDDSINKLKRGQMHPYTQALLMDLAARGMLMLEHNGMQYTWKRALFKAKTSDRGEERVVFVIKSTINNGVSRIADAKYAPTITGPLWGEVSASNKRGVAAPAPAAASAAQDSVTAASGTQAGTSSQSNDGPVPEQASRAGPSVPAGDPDDSPFPAGTPSRPSEPVTDGGAAGVASDSASEWSPLSDEHDDAVVHAAPSDSAEGGFVFTEPPVIPEPPKKLPPLDFSMLEAFAISGEKVFGMISRKLDDGQTAYLFDLEEIKLKYLVNMQALPDGVGIHRRKSDDKLYIYIAI